MPPHDILATADILHEIFQHLRVTIPGAGKDISILEVQENQRTLSRAARVSKAFCDPALRSLWWAIPSGIEPALMLLSAVHVVQTPRFITWAPEDIQALPQYDISLEREISTSDWARFTTYAAYIRFIYNTRTSERRPIPHDLLSALRALSNGKPLFPHLKVYTWDPSTLHHVELSLFVPQGLNSLIVDVPDNDLGLEFRNNGDSTSFASDLDSATQSLRSLLALDFRKLPGASGDQAVWMLVIQRWRDLQLLSFDFTFPLSDMVLFKKLSQLPALRELVLNICLPSEVASHDLDFRGFPALQTLTLRLHNRFLTSVLPVFASPRLVSLSVESYVRDSAEVASAFNLVAGMYRTLRTVTFRWTCPELPRIAPELDDFDTVFGSLLHLHTIEEFTLRTPRALFVSTGGDAELARLAQSWPKLRVLSLYATLRGPLTHTALLPFAHGCPDLRTLHLRNVVFLHLTAETFAAIATPAPAAHRLQELHICDALVDDASEAPSAELISRLFPSARWYPLAWSSRSGRECCSHAGFSCNVAMAKLVPHGASPEVLNPGFEVLRG
ncbi:hypothetical protein TRAPUB_2617 [Trametes pubescens]|uniref:F-box domain-containing protein n=1 Tax=Trametes pubescens TaxID=154538 RepID=A0A1M2VG21_TRAPU|nr:hypothetical protein TRAPUB_2617 [Trametes pubescens]